MSVSLKDYSIVSWFEDVEKHRCGYCKSENNSVSNGKSMVFKGYSI